jgi:hypothetical protein
MKVFAAFCWDNCATFATGAAARTIPRRLYNVKGKTLQKQLTQSCFLNIGKVCKENKKHIDIL